MKILLAVDGSPCSQAAINEVVSRPWPKGSFLRVVTAYEPPVPPTLEGWGMPANYSEELQSALRRRAHDIVEAALQELKVNQDYSADGFEVCGPPRLAILEITEQWGADLIVIGSHGYSGLKRFLLGSVSLAVVSHAKCSVEVVRCNDNEEAQ